MGVREERVHTTVGIHKARPRAAARCPCGIGSGAAPAVMYRDLDGPEPKQPDLADRRQPDHKGRDRGANPNKLILFLLAFS
jgi:hypothetical protein